MTDAGYHFPENYDFEKAFNQNFGIIKDDAFEVEIEFSGYAAAYVAERIWSPDQKIKKMKNGNNRLTFTVSSEPELIAWLLSWGDEAKVMRPGWLVKGIKKKAEGIVRKYS